MTALEFWGRGENWEAGMADASPAVKEGLRRHLAAALALRQDLPEPSPAVESRSRAAWQRELSCARDGSREPPTRPPPAGGRAASRTAGWPGWQRAWRSG